MTTPVSRVFGSPGGGKALATAQQALAVADATAEQTEAAVTFANAELATSKSDRQQIWTKIHSNMSRLTALEEALQLLGEGAGGDSVAALLPKLTQLQVRMDELERDPGPAGENGKSVELMAGADGVLWRQTGGQWQPLFSFDQVRGLPGVNGKSTEMGIDQGAIAWRYAGGQWHPLVDLQDLNGEDGQDGSDGVTPQLRAGATGVEARFGDGAWDLLVPYATITGPGGDNGVTPQLRAGEAGVETRVKDGPWTLLVPYQAITGPGGGNGLTPQLRAGVSGVEARFGDGGWSTLVPYSAITGPGGGNGLTPQLRAGASGIESRFGDGAWTVLVPYATITGPGGGNGLTPQLRAGASGIESRLGDGAWTVLLPYSAITGPAGVDVTNLRIGVGVSTVILLGATADVTITWDTPMPSATYEVRVSDGAIVGKGTVTKKSQTAAAVVYTVKSTALAISAGTMLVAVARA